jgi:hypothetical protein
LLMTLATNGLPLAQSFRTAANGDETQLSAALASALQANPDAIILGEASAPQRYMFRTETAPTQWKNTEYFSYKGLTGQEAYLTALRDQYFGVIFLRGPSPNAKFVLSALRDGRAGGYYSRSAVVPFSVQGTSWGDWQVWIPQSRVGEDST